jgi:hypothetical protein
MSWVLTVISKPWARLRACAALGMAILREIFDESAYVRFLSRRGIAPSSRSYAAFLHEHEHLRARRPRCC